MNEPVAPPGATPLSICPAGRWVIQREHALEGFRSGRHRVLIATDGAARRIDITGITHVINYELPMVATDYIHRVGRTIATYGIPVAAGAGGNGGGEARRTCELVITPTSGERRAFSCKV